MVKIKQKIIDEGDEYFTGLIDCDSNDDDFPHRLIIHESDDSEDDDDEHDADQIEMQHIYEQQERNRNRKQVSAVDSQIKTEPDDTEDTGGHHTSLEMVESLTPLSTEDTEEHSTIPSSEDLLEVGVSQQSKEGEESQQADDKRPQMVRVKRSERPTVSKGEIQLYVPPGR